MVDANETLIPISKAPAHIPSRPHVATVWRWIKNGVRGVTLDTIVIGGKRYTSREAIQRFMEATTAASSQPVGKAARSRSRQQAIERAEREVEAAANS